MAGAVQESAALDLVAAQQGLDAQPFSRLVPYRPDAGRRCVAAI
ncbi:MULTISPECIES: hypothetical protein [unclassified Streptomyces]|nr:MULTISPECIES: hypothetical protein [unclassified Streptomyces]